MQGHREPWYAACCRTLALRPAPWKRVDETWEERSSYSAQVSTKSGEPRAGSDGWEALDDNHGSEGESGVARTASHAAVPKAPAMPAVASQDVPPTCCSLSRGRLHIYSPAKASQEENKEEDVEEHEEQPLSPQSQQKRLSFGGRWVCVATFGLQDFLKKEGFSKMQRLAASRTPWPEWEFDQDGDRFKFVNRSAMGDLIEEFVVGGPGHTSLDGWRQSIASRAIWERATLVIERKGPQGLFREERFVDSEGNLQFRLRKSNGSNGAPEAPPIASLSGWGRTFRRKGP